MFSPRDGVMFVVERRVLLYSNRILVNFCSKFRLSCFAAFKLFFNVCTERSAKLLMDGWHYVRNAIHLEKMYIIPITNIGLLYDTLFEDKQFAQ